MGAKTCENCAHWKTLNEDDPQLWPEDYDDDQNDVDVVRVSGFVVGKCADILEFNRPMIQRQASVVDGSHYRAELWTSPQFGCVNHLVKEG